MCFLRQNVRLSLWLLSVDGGRLSAKVPPGYWGRRENNGGGGGGGGGGVREKRRNYRH